MVVHSTLAGADLHNPRGANPTGSLTLTANASDAMVWLTGANDLLRINTSTGAIVASWGNTTDNPAFNWLGSGLATFNGTISCPGTGVNTEKFGASITTGTAIRVTAVGRSVNAQRDESTLIGYNTSTNAIQNVVVGATAFSNGAQAIAIGYGASAGGTASVSIGNLAQGGNTGGIAIGQSAQCGFVDSIAMGRSTQTTVGGQMMIGSASFPYSEFCFGGGDINNSGSGMTFRTSNASGSNGAGGAITLAPGRSTGTAAAGDLIINGADSGSSGASLNAAVERFRVVGASGDVQLNKRANGQFFTEGSLSQNLTLAAAVSTDSTINIPANSIVLAVTARVTTLLVGPAAWMYGKATDATPNRYGASLALAAGTTSVGLDSNGGVQQNASAVAVRVRSQDGTTAFSAGVIRLTMHYLTFTPPTS